MRDLPLAATSRARRPRLSHTPGACLAATGCQAHDPSAATANGPLIAYTLPKSTPWFQPGDVSFVLTQGKTAIKSWTKHVASSRFGGFSRPGFTADGKYAFAQYAEEQVGRTVVWQAPTPINASDGQIDLMQLDLSQPNAAPSVLRTVQLSPRNPEQRAVPYRDIGFTGNVVGARHGRVAIAKSACSIRVVRGNCCPAGAVAACDLHLCGALFQALSWRGE